MILYAKRKRVILSKENILTMRRAEYFGKSLSVPILMGLCATIVGVQFWQRSYGHIRLKLEELSQVFRGSFYYAAFFLLILYGQFGAHQFIYFQF